MEQNIVNVRLPFAVPYGWPGLQNVHSFLTGEAKVASETIRKGGGGCKLPKPSSVLYMLSRNISRQCFFIDIFKFHFEKSKAMHTGRKMCPLLTASQMRSADTRATLYLPLWPHATRTSGVALPNWNLPICVKTLPCCSSTARPPGNGIAGATRALTEGQPR